MEINLGNLNDKKEIHKIFKEKFNFPDYYGENFDAFWDLISENKNILPNKIIFKNFNDYSNKFESYSKILKEILNYYKKQINNPFEVLYE